MLRAVINFCFGTAKTDVWGKASSVRLSAFHPSLLLYSFPVRSMALLSDMSFCSVCVENYWSLFFLLGLWMSFNAFWARVSLCRSSLPRTHKDPPASASLVLGLQAHATHAWHFYVGFGDSTEIHMHSRRAPPRLGWLSKGHLYCHGVLSLAINTDQWEWEEKEKRSWEDRQGVS